MIYSMESPMDWIAILERLGSIGLLFMIFWKLPNLIEMYNKGIRETMSSVQKIQDDSLKHSDAQVDKLINSFNIRFEKIENVLGKLVEVSNNAAEKLGDIERDRKTS